MIAANVLMEDMDKDQWSHDQDLLLESSKEKNRIIVLHDNGVIRKIARTDGSEVKGKPASITDANVQAKQLYEANKEGLDFVAIFERHAFDEYFSKMQDSWIADEPVDSFVYRQYKLLDQYPDTMVTYPGPAKTQMGMQFRLGVSLNEAFTLSNKWVSPNTSILLGVYDHGCIWASLVFTFNEKMEISVLTTVNPEKVNTVGDMAKVTDNAFDWLKKTHQSGAAALVWNREEFDVFRAAKDKEKAVVEGLAKGSVVLRTAH